MSAANPTNLDEITDQVDQMESILDDLEEVANDNGYQEVEDLTYEFRDEVDNLLNDFERVERGWQTYDRKIREHIDDWINRLENIENPRRQSPPRTNPAFGAFQSGYWSAQPSMYQQQSFGNGSMNQSHSFNNNWHLNQNQFVKNGFDPFANFCNNSNYRDQNDNSSTYEDVYKGTIGQTSGFVQMTQSVNGQTWHQEFTF